MISIANNFFVAGVMFPLEDTMTVNEAESVISILQQREISRALIESNGVNDIGHGFFRCERELHTDHSH
jgi:hypothetical protein